MKLKTIKMLLNAFILSLCFFAASFTMAYSQDLFTSAANDAVAKAIKSLDSCCRKGPCGNMDKKVAVWEVEDDQNSVIWNRLQIGLVKGGNFKVYTMAETEHAKKILKEQSLELKYQDRYNPGALIELGGMIPPKSIIVAKAEYVETGGACSELTLVFNLLDLTTGQIVWGDISKGRGKVVFTPVQWAWRGLVCLAVLVLCVFFVFWANWQSLRFIHFWIFLAAIIIGAFWFLIGQYL